MSAPRGAGFRLLGSAPVRAGGAAIVVTPDSPNVWDANFALPDTDADPDKLMTTLDEAMVHSDWRVVVADALTGPDMEAALALAGYTPGVTTIEMLAPSPISSTHPLPAISLRAVDSEEDWSAMIPLVRADHVEGKRTGNLSDSVSDGLIAAMRRRAVACDYSFIVLDGTNIGYGMTANCPSKLGLIEELFTLPEARGRGVMSAFLVMAAERLRAQGCDGVFLDAHADGTPKVLYARLGFRPVSITRKWVRDVTAVSQGRS